ncbi:MAG: T9SS type A sorting domain-containing protein [Bacteroidota bacterium]
MYLRTTLSLVGLLLVCFHFSCAQQPSALVFEDQAGCLRYVMDQNDNRIVDFSYAGYKNGNEAIPEVPTLVSVKPIAGDNTAYLQQIIDSVANLTPNAAGIRGAILLEAGNYEIHGTVRIQASGIVLKGVGNGENVANNTILTGVGNTPNQRNLIEVGGLRNADWTDRVAGSTAQITSSFIPVGARTIAVDRPELYNIGDDVIIFHPSTDAWLASVDYGATAGDDPWRAGQIDIFYKRTITAVNLTNGKLTLDVPIYDHLDRNLSTAEIYRLAETDIKTNIGIENLSINISTNGELTEDHVRTAIFLRGVKDCWVSDVTAFHFIYAAVDMTVADRVTVKNCNGLEPHSLITGARRYNFNVSQKSNNILFTGCTASEGRHSFVSNGTSSASGIVWHNCESTKDYSASEGHRRWSQALLFDNISFIEPNEYRLLALFCRGSFGTGHGWAATHSVAWHVDMPASNACVIQRPPNRQNYAIACKGRVTGVGPFNHPTGYIEGSGTNPTIRSLYETQLSDRLNSDVAVDAPARFKLEQIDDDILISWLDIADNETGYVIEIAYDGVTFNKFAELAANTNSYRCSKSQLSEPTASFRMYAAASCPSAYTHTYSLNLPVNTKKTIPSETKITPNPTTDFLNLATHNQIINRLQIFNINGKLIPTQYTTGNPLDVRHLPKGVYILKIELQAGNYVINKFVKL